MTNVAVLGSGAMGSAMARRLADAGFAVIAWDRNPKRLGQWSGAAVQVADTAADAAKTADAVITMVTDGAAVESVASAMLPAMRSEAVWIQSSTVGANWADKLRGMADAADRMMLDAPVSGSTQPAKAGTLTWLVAGPGMAVERARPVLNSLGERVIVVGAGQQASRLKLAVNTWMTCTTVAMADTLAACDALGLPRKLLLEVLSGGPLGMPYALQKAELMNDGQFAPGFPVELALKDIWLTEEAERRQPPLVHAVEQRLERAVANGHGRDDVAAVAAVE